MSIAGSTLGSTMTGQRWTTTAQTATLAVLEPREPPGFLEQARIAQQTQANNRQRGRKGSQVSFDGLAGKEGDVARLTTVNADAMSSGFLGADAKDLDEEASQRADLKAQLTRTSWTLARNGHQQKRCEEQIAAWKRCCREARAAAGLPPLQAHNAKVSS